MQHAICLDANIFIAGLSHEPQGETSRQLLDRLLIDQTVMIEPGLVSFEVASVLRRKVVMNEMSEDHMKRALNYFLEFPIYMEWQNSLLFDACDAAVHLRQKNVYDPSYLAVAKMRYIPLVTLNAELLVRGKNYYQRIWSVEGYLSVLKN